MNAPRRLRLFVPLLAVMALACSVTFDLGMPPLVRRDALPTMVAQTLEAMTQQAFLALPTSTPLPTATSIPTSTPVPPTLSVSSATDCFAGPSSKYGFVITIRPGTIVTVVGKDAADNYWVINVPAYPGTVCWLSGQYAQLSGETAHLPEPATPQPSRYTLSEPRGLGASCSYEDLCDDDDEDCYKSRWTVHLSWDNSEPDQAGVRIFRNGWQIATLGGRAHAYTDSFVHHHRHDAVTYGVQAYRGQWLSSIVSTSLRHCHD